MKDWKQILVSPTDSIIRTIEVIDQSSMQLALVVDENNHLLGTVTDGDIRRSILKRIDLDTSIDHIMNKNFSFSKIEDGREKALAIMSNKQLHHLPVLDEQGNLAGVRTIDSLLVMQPRDNIIVLMAGGLGSRLQQLTENCPKPLLEVGGKPILVSILESFIEQGFKKFYISINYRGEMIEKYFKDGSRWGVDIDYIREDKRLGTAGALSLLPERNEKPIIVMNGDILTKVDYRSLLDFHNNQGADATMCVQEYQLEVPFGVVAIEQSRLKGLEEKPKERFYINAGLYVLNPDVIDHIPQDAYFDMTELFKILMNKQRYTSVYPIQEYWMDIGRVDDYERANGEYPNVFK
ncbi:MAG: nucleotidyltransferase family protein [Deltaproteobacteria bacterium]